MERLVQSTFKVHTNAAGNKYKVNHHLEQKFPDDAGAFQELANRDKAFASALTDYEELCTWFGVWKRSASPHEIEDVLELIEELENEIRQKLEANHELTR